MEFLMLSGVLVIASILLAFSWTAVKRVLQYLFFFLGLIVILFLWLWDKLVEVWHDFKRGW